MLFVMFLKIEADAMDYSPYPKRGFVTVGTTSIDDLLHLVLQPDVLDALEENGYTNISRFIFDASVWTGC